MSSDQSKDLDTLREEAANSLKKAYDLVDQLRSVQEYESIVLKDAFFVDPPRHHAG
jgi:hypothetical protein